MLTMARSSETLLVTLLAYTDVVGGNRWVGILCCRDDVTLAFLLKKLILHAIDEARDDDDSCVEACGTCLM